MSINKNQPDTRIPQPKKVKVYVALMNQTGTNAPVATVLQNTLGEEVIWTRFTTGQYVGSTSGVFTANKTFSMIKQNQLIGGGSVQILDRSGDIAFEIWTGSPAGIAADGILIDIPIEIRVYE